MYQIIDEKHVIYLPENAVITLPTAESYGFAYEAWLANGNTPLPAGQPEPAHIADLERAWRDAELLKADVEVNKAVDSAHPAESAWRKYRVALRNWPQSDGFPEKSGRPNAPTGDAP